jgi:hypothetical protein
MGVYQLAMALRFHAFSPRLYVHSIKILHYPEFGHVFERYIFDRNTQVEWVFCTHLFSGVRHV